MIGAVVLEWFYQSTKRRDTRLAEARLDEYTHTAARDEFAAQLEAVQAELLVEDAKTGADYSPDRIYALLGRERLLTDQVCAEQFGALVAYGDQAR